MDGRANPLMDRKVVGVVFLECLQWSPQPQLLDVVWCSVVYVVWCSAGVVVAVFAFVVVAVAWCNYCSVV